ncbi:dihydrolipoamide acetyltransferase family protein [Listeria ilorinensis]|uniref:dihydrolipoamide acetyltransferase family protein n=1 Tax=Listeria ilorinensis TaxID=2867439 RepID=UPI001EF6F27A|nr:dihydrolipoamide acetyltransferase family protein [Listeria ilorinensis]
MAYLFKLPDVGEGLTEADILTWYVKEGDVIKADDPLVEIQNDKSTMEIPSPVSGKVVKILVPDGIAQVDEGIIEIDTGEEEAVSESAPKEQEVLPEKEITEISRSSASSRVRALPSVRRYARQCNVDLAAVTPTGPKNKVLKTDIDAYLAGNTGAIVENSAEEALIESEPTVYPSVVHDRSDEGDWTEKMTPLRKATAKAMVTSRTEIPHVTVFDKLRSEKLVAHRAMYKEFAKHENIKLTYLPYVVKALVAMLKAYPVLNASVNMEKAEIIHHRSINIGIATNTDHGLFVPVIKHADRKSVFEIAEEISILSEKAMANKLTYEEMSGSSATITNIGGLPGAGGIWSTPIINYPESMIMGIARISDEVVVNAEREMEVASIMRLSFAFDHRLIDGVEAQKALAAFKKALEDPNLMLLKN